MVNIFLRAIYLYDDRMTLILNGGDRPITIDNILLDEIEEHFEEAVSSHVECSPLVAVAPPLNRLAKTSLLLGWSVFFCDRGNIDIDPGFQLSIFLFSGLCPG